MEPQHEFRQPPREKHHQDAEPPLPANQDRRQANRSARDEIHGHEERTTAGRDSRNANGNADDDGEDTNDPAEDRKSTRLNSSHSQISYAVFCLKKKNITFRVTTEHQK